MNSISFFKALLMKELNEKDGAEFTKKYNDNPKLKGGQKNLPDQLQAQIVKKEVDTPNPPTDYSGKPSIPGLGPIVDMEEGEDHEVSMAQNSLKSIISSASQLMNMLGQDEKDIPAWIQDHITNAENYINQASKNYHEYHNGEHDMDELPDGTIEEPAGDAEDLDTALQSIAEAEFISLKDFSKNLELYKKGDITKSQLINSYNKLSAEDQDKAKEHAKNLDVLPNPKKTNEISLQSMMEDLFEAKKKPSAGLSKKQKSAIVKKAKSGKDMGKKGKGFEKIVKAAKKSGADNPEAVAGAAFWKGQAKKAK
jgi:hypothetical protein